SIVAAPLATCHVAPLGRTHTSNVALLTSMPIQSCWRVVWSTAKSWRLDCRDAPGLVDAGSPCAGGPGNCAGCARDRRDDLAFRRSVSTKERAVCPIRGRRPSSLAERSIQIQGARSELASGAATGGGGRAALPRPGHGVLPRTGTQALTGRSGRCC